MKKKVWCGLLAGAMLFSLMSVVFAGDDPPAPRKPRAQTTLEEMR